MDNHGTQTALMAGGPSSNDVLGARANTKCRPEFESKEAWRHFLERATEQEAYDAIGEVLRLARSFEQYGKATSKRLHKFFDDGAAIYAKRFGSEWVPF